MRQYELRSLADGTLSQFHKIADDQKFPITTKKQKHLAVYLFIVYDALIKYCDSFEFTFRSIVAVNYSF